MPIVKESELEQKEEFNDCCVCGEFIGDIYLCGIGMICTSCFARESGEDECNVFFEENLTQEVRDRARANIRNAGEEE